MKNKKVLLLILSTLVIGSVFGGCGKDTNKVNDTQVETTQSTEVESEAKSEDTDYDTLLSKVELCKLDNIKLTTKKSEVTDEDVNKEVKTFISSVTYYEKIKNRKVKDTDSVVISYSGTVDGKKFSGCEAEDVVCDIDDNSYIDGFASGLVGHKPGDKVTLHLTFPDNYETTDVAGKDVTYTITIDYIQGDKVEPEMTNAFIKEYTDWGSLSEVKKDVKKSLEQKSEDNYDTTIQNELLDYLIENSKLPEIPNSYITDYKADMQSYYNNAAQAAGVGYTEFLQNTLGLTEDEFDAESTKTAKNYMQSKLILDTLAKTENITLSDDEFDAYAEKFAKKIGYNSKDEFLSMMESNGETDDFKEEALYDKIVKTLISKYSE